MIMKLHPSNFKSYAMRNLTLEEMRAIWACLPEFKADQKMKMDWKVK